jgi:hypothetical protein
MLHHNRCKIARLCKSQSVLATYYAIIIRVFNKTHSIPQPIPISHSPLALRVDPLLASSWSCDYNSRTEPHLCSDIKSRYRHCIFTNKLDLIQATSLINTALKECLTVIPFLICYKPVLTVLLHAVRYNRVSFLVNIFERSNYFFSRKLLLSSAIFSQFTHLFSLDIPNQIS